MNDVAASDHVALEVVELALSPLALFEHFVREPFAVLLDSAASAGRYSVVAVGPRRVLSARHDPQPSAALADAELEERCWEHARFGEPSTITRERGDPFGRLADWLEAARLPAELRALYPDLPFVGGAIGFAGYDAGRFLERLPERALRDLPVPELCFLWVDAVFVHDHTRAVTQLITTGRGTSAEAARLACARLRAEFQARVAGPLPPSAAGAPRVGALHAHADAEGYAATVRAAREHVLAGDVFEVCTAHRLEVPYHGSAWQLYQTLRAQSPAAFACYVATPWATLLSSSPERFLALDREGWAESRPIKGTRPRAADESADLQLRDELLHSEKDRAENVMIVDLVRNDLGRVCEVNSVTVTELMVVERHPHVWHLVSTVRGRLRPELGPVDLFKACFPPGSMTGAPKIEAMKIIDALEPYRRSIYAGAVGYFDAGGGLDFSVVIRSFVLSGQRCCFSVGGAVVADSDPHAEYAETMDKARALLDTLALLRAAGAPA